MLLKYSDLVHDLGQIHKPHCNICILVCLQLSTGINRLLIWFIVATKINIMHNVILYV